MQTNAQTRAPLLPPPPTSTVSYYSLQHIQKGIPYPPLPYSPFPEAKLLPLGEGQVAYDDRKVDYEALYEEARCMALLMEAELGPQGTE